MQSVPITTNSVSSNPTQVRCTQYNIMWSNLSVICGTSVVSSTNKTDCHDITEILLKVALNTIILTLTLISKGNIVKLNLQNLQYSKIKPTESSAAESSSSWAMSSAQSLSASYNIHM
jgi:hypothetical protein